jgi:transcriptional regulator with XRE-family HTH domain
MTPLTGAQVKAARELLGWSQEKLGGAARVSRGTVATFENNEKLPARYASIRKALADAGIEFTDKEAAGVRLRR